MADLNKLVEDISALSLLEAAELVKLLEGKLGVTAAAPMAMAAMSTQFAAGPCEGVKFMEGTTIGNESDIP